MGMEVESQILPNVVQVEEVRGAEEVNKYLSGGKWRLLKVLTKREPMTDVMVDGSQEVAIYVIGWPYKGKKPEYPK